MSFNQVDRHNLSLLFLTIKLAIQKASFIAIDTEFTGLNAKKTRNQNIEDRYVAIRELCLSHAVIALGITIGSKSENGFKVDNFYFNLLPMKDYLISPSSISFLVQHGFNFNDQFLNGIPFADGLDRTDLGKDHPNTMLRKLFNDILRQKCPVVVHNGLLDLAYLYQSFYAPLPLTLPMFLADLSEMFKGGIYDTKFTSDFVTREQSSFLSLLFRK